MRPNRSFLFTIACCACAISACGVLDTDGADGPQALATQRSHPEAYEHDAAAHCHGRSSEGADRTACNFSFAETLDGKQHGTTKYVFSVEAGEMIAMAQLDELDDDASNYQCIEGAAYSKLRPLVRDYLSCRENPPSGGCEPKRRQFCAEAWLQTKEGRIKRVECVDKDDLINTVPKARTGELASNPPPRTQLVSSKSLNPSTMKWQTNTSVWLKRLDRDCYEEIALFITPHERLTFGTEYGNGCPNCRNFLATINHPACYALRGDLRKELDRMPWSERNPDPALPVDRSGKFGLTLQNCFEVPFLSDPVYRRTVEAPAKAPNTRWTSPMEQFGD